jgi:aminobenzoyl-glutamate utilization protein B
MLVAARTLALSAVELFQDPAELQAARADFDKRRAGRKWTTLIAPDATPPVDGAGKP